MIEQIGNWIHQYGERINEHREEHHRKALQSMVEQLNQWDYRHKDPYKTADFLMDMVIRARFNLGFLVDNMQPEEMPDELVQFCKNRTEDQPHESVRMVFPDIDQVQIRGEQSSGMYFFLNPYNRHHPPISVWGYGEGEDKYDQNSPQWKLELMGKVIAAAADHELSQY